MECAAYDGVCCLRWSVLPTMERVPNHFNDALAMASVLRLCSVSQILMGRTGEVPYNAETQPPEPKQQKKVEDFRLGLIYTLIINTLFALGVLAVFARNRVPYWLWILFAIKQLLSFPIYVALDNTFNNIGKVSRGQTIASLSTVVGLIALQIILKTVVVHYSSEFTNIPMWVWSFASFSSIILVLLSTLAKYQDELADLLGVGVADVNIAVRVGILLTLAIYSASTVALAYYGQQAWTTAIFVIVIIFQLAYAFKSYLLPDQVLDELQANNDRIQTE